MATILAGVALVALSVTLVLTVVTIWLQAPSAAQYLELTKALLSWQVIAGGLAMGAVRTFHSQIAELLGRL